MRVHNPDSVVATGGRYAHGIETPLGEGSFMSPGK